MGGPSCLLSLLFASGASWRSRGTSRWTRQGGNRNRDIRVYKGWLPPSHSTFPVYRGYIVIEWFSTAASYFHAALKEGHSYIRVRYIPLMSPLRADG